MVIEDIQANLPELKNSAQWPATTSLFSSMALAHSHRGRPNWYSDVRTCLEDEPEAGNSPQSCVRKMYRDFIQARDGEGAYNCWSLLVDSCFVWGNEPDDLQDLLDELVELRRMFPLFPSLPVAANIKVAQFAASLGMLVENSQHMDELADNCRFLFAQSSNPYFRKRAQYYLHRFEDQKETLGRDKRLS